MFGTHCARDIYFCGPDHTASFNINNLSLIQRGVDGGRLFARASGATVPACSHDGGVCWERELSSVRHTTETCRAQGAPLGSPVMRTAPALTFFAAIWA